MMNKLISKKVIIIVLATLIMVGGISLLIYRNLPKLSNPSLEPKEESTFQKLNDNKDISVSIVEGSIARTGLTISYDCKNKEEYGINSLFYLEKQKDGKWFKLPLKNRTKYDCTHITMMWPKKGEENRQMIRWEYLYGQLTNGTYRIIFKASKNPSDPNKGCYISTEFKIHYTWDQSDQRYGTTFSTEESKVKKVNDSKENVTMSIKEGTLTPTGATLLIKNQSKHEVGFGTEYHLEVKLGDKWYEVPYFDSSIGGVAWALVGVGVDAGETFEYPLSWEFLYGALREGTYRIRKEVGGGNLAVEFDIPSK